ncbi:MAG: tetratricopeptide repeat protein [Alphaproteobacteria bacterium]|nr:tetratricopeptide repeat protein [Alphaproteobacteria bacterium]
MADLLQEIIEDVRAERANALWTKYGKWMIYTAVSIIIITAMMVYWSHHKRETAMRQTALYLEATDLLARGDAAHAMMSLEKISVPERSAYYGMVLLKKAQAQHMLGKKDDAQKTFETLAKRDGVYGAIGKAMLKTPVDKTLEKTAPLQMTQREWSAWDAVSKGQDAKAAEQFAAIAAIPDVPATMHDRALMMANYLKDKSGAARHD